MLEQLEDRTTPSSISGLSPAFGPTAGNGSVQIYGSGFTGATSVTFGGVATFGVMVMSDTTISVQAPAHAAGVVDVVVTAPSGVSPITSADQYTYDAPAAPAVTSVSPNTGSTAGGMVTIDGSGFYGPDGMSDVSGVSFGGAASGMYYVMGDGVIDAYAPAHAAGLVDVTVTTANGTSAMSSADQFTYIVPPPPPAPAVTSLSPDSGTTAGGSYGDDRRQRILRPRRHVQRHRRVLRRRWPRTMYYTMGDGVIDAYAPAHAAGTVDVTVTTAAGTSSTSSADQYTYDAPPPASTTTYLYSSADPSTVGEAVTLYAQVYNGGQGTATGTVTFTDGSDSLATVALSDGEATFTTTSLALGSHPITAAYSGDASDAASTSEPLNQVVQQLSTTTYLYPSSYTPTYGQSVTLTASVYNGGQGTPTGQVEFLDGGNDIGSGTLSGGQAVLTISSLTVGDHTLTAAYLGDSADAGSTSYTANVTVQQASTTTTLTSSANPSDVGQAVTFTAEVDGVSGGVADGDDHVHERHDHTGDGDAVSGRQRQPGHAHTLDASGRQLLHPGRLLRCRELRGQRIRGVAANGATNDEHQPIRRRRQHHLGQRPGREARGERGHHCGHLGDGDGDLHGGHDRPGEGNAFGDQPELQPSNAHHLVPDTRRA